MAPWQRRAIVGHPETFVHREGASANGVGLIAVLALLLSAVVSQLLLGRPPGPEPVVVAVVVAVLAYFSMGIESRVVLDETGLRYTESPVRFGVLRPATVAWAIPAAGLTAVREITARVPSSRGGWNSTTHLHFSDTHRIHDLRLGMKGVPASAYESLTASLKRRLGDRFTVETLT